MASIQKNTVFDKLNCLNEEISEGLRNLSEVGRESVDEEIALVKEASYRERAPEAELALRLFRKYADVAHTIKRDAENNSKNKEEFVSNNALFEVPPYVLQGNSEQLVGYQATKKNIFWLRALTALSSFISYVIMASNPYISYARLSADDAFMVDSPLCVCVCVCVYLHIHTYIYPYIYLSPSILLIVSIFLSSIILCHSHHYIHTLTRTQSLTLTLTGRLSAATLDVRRVPHAALSSSPRSGSTGVPTLRPLHPLLHPAGGRSRQQIHPW